MGRSFKTWLIFALALAVPSCCWASASSVQRAVFQAVWQEINTNYYDTDFGGKNWEAIGERYRKRLSAIESSTAFDQLMTEMLRELGDSHFSIASPAFNELMPNAWRGGGKGMDLSVVENRVIVHRVYFGGASNHCESQITGRLGADGLTESRTAKKETEKSRF